MSNLLKKTAGTDPVEGTTVRSTTNTIDIGKYNTASGNKQCNATCTVNASGNAPANINVNFESKPGGTDEPDSCCSGDVTISDLKRRLKEWYKDLQLPRVTWMKQTSMPLEEYYIPLRLNSLRRTKTSDDAGNDRCNVLRKNNQEGSCSQESTIENVKSMINLADIFGKINGNRPKRILIESQPGLGKTTLVHKIMHDWQMEATYVRNFDLALFIPLRHLKERSVKEAILEILKLKRGNITKIWNLINSEKTLLVLDGLDEVDESARKNISDMLYDKIESKLSIIVTCRTGLFKLSEGERNDLFLGVEKCDHFWDKNIEILGFDGKNREKFLKKFVEAENKNEILKKVREIIKSAEEMLQSPLLLILLVFILLDNETVMIKTKSELYKKLVDCVIRRSVSKDKNLKLVKNFTLFDKTTCGDYRINFSTFGEMSMTHILNDDLQFECDDFTDLIYGMGFLLKHETMKNKFNVVPHYEGCHLTFLEFAAAFSLWDQFEKNGNKFPIGSIHKINEICLKKGSLSMILPFLCGLMGSNVGKLFDQLFDFRAMYSANTDLMVAISRECELDGCKIIENFLPKSLTFNGSGYRFLINKNLNKYSNIIVTYTDLWKFAERKNMYAESIITLIPEYIFLELNGKCNFKHDVNCDNIFIDVYKTYWYRSNSQVADQLCLMLNGVTSSYKHLLLYKYCNKNVINECVKSGVLKNQTIDYLCFGLTDMQIDIELLENIIKHNTVKKLELCLSRQSDFTNLDKIIPIVVLSPDLLSLKLTSESSKMAEVDLSTITNNGKKCWRHIGLHGIILKNGASLFNNECIESFEIKGGFCDVETILALKLSALHFSYKLYADCCMLEHAAGLKSVTVLTLDMTEGVYQSLDSLRCLDKFIKLKKVTLLLKKPLESEQQRDIVKCLRSLRLDHLQFCCYEVWLVADIINCVTDLLAKNELESIGNIVFVLETKFEMEITKYSDTLSALKLALLSDSKVIAHFKNYVDRRSDEYWHAIFNIFDLRQFNIQHRNRISFHQNPFVGTLYFGKSWKCADVLEIQKKCNVVTA